MINNPDFIAKQLAAAQLIPAVEVPAPVEPVSKDYDSVPRPTAFPVEPRPFPGRKPVAIGNIVNNWVEIEKQTTPVEPQTPEA